MPDLEPTGSGDLPEAQEAPEPACECCGSQESTCDCSICDYWRCNRRVESVCSECHRCSDHCDCIFCQGCDSAVDGTCSECDRCGDCCSCLRCRSCDEIVRRVCDNDRCGGCCEDCGCCGPRVSFFGKGQAPTFHAASALRRKANPSRRFLAAEIEVAKIASHPDAVASAVRKWKGAIVPDGSLPSGGFEINTSPASGDLFLAQIREICDALDYADAEVTSACGCHVHADARDLSHMEIRKLMLLWDNIEAGIYAMIPSYRRESHYCEPCASKYTAYMTTQPLSSKEVRQHVNRAVYGRLDRSLPRMKKDKYNSNRYAGLNLHSWFHRGTVELRVPPGSVDPTEISRWAMLLGYLLDWVVDHSEKEILAMQALPPKTALLAVLAKREDLKDHVQSMWDRHA